MIRTRCIVYFQTSPRWNWTRKISALNKVSKIFRVGGKIYGWSGFRKQQIFLGLNMCLCVSVSIGVSSRAISSVGAPAVLRRRRQRHQQERKHRPACLRSQRTGNSSRLMQATSSRFKVVIWRSRSVFLARPPTRSSIKITSRSFRYASPHLWNQLPHSLRQPRLDLSLPDSSLLHDHLTSPVLSSPLLSSITPSFFHSKLKTFLFLKSYHP